LVPNKRTGPISIFISYSTKDKNVAGEIKKGLEKLGFNCFLAHEDLPAGEWREHIDTELEKFDVFLPLLTDAARESVWVHQESGIAHKRKKKDCKNTSIIPLKVEYDPEGCLSIYQAYQLRFGFWGGLEFESKEILALSKKFVKEIEGRDRARTYALRKLSNAFPDEANIILDFALWAGITLDDTKLILKTTSSNPSMAQSNGVHHKIKICYNHYEQYLRDDSVMEISWKKYDQAVRRRWEKENRQRQAQLDALAEIIKQSGKNKGKNGSSNKESEPVKNNQPQEPTKAGDNPL